MDNKNTIIAIALMLVVWVGFSLLFPPAPPETVTKVAPEAVEQEAPSQGVLAPTERRTEPASGAESGPVSESGEVPDREIVVENDFYRAVFSSSGARIVQFELKDYTVEPDEGSENISLVSPGGPQFGTLRTTGSDGLGLPPDAPYAISVSEPSLFLAAGERQEITFSTRLANGVVVEKVFTFYGDSYAFDLITRLRNGGASPVSGALSVQLVQPWDEGLAGNRFDFVGAMTLVEDEIAKITPDDLLEDGAQVYGTGAVWSGFSDKYFLRASVPLEGAAQKVVVEMNQGALVNALVSPPVTLAPGEVAVYSYLNFFGPKDIDLLQGADHRLGEAIDLGFFSFLARPLLHVLKFFYSFIGNYGVAIILLTVIIKLLFWPLTQKSYASMKEMQKLQPQMQKVREKYKNDRERLNRELMELYKKNRVNPLGGCLPMIIQIPVFFALYKVLLGSIELRHAPFALWITDLSVKDPFYITPVIMGATMFIQQKMTPTQMDPTQAKLFLLMPVIFTFMFLNFPAGLVIYWLVNNVLTIGQQYLINKKK